MDDYQCVMCGEKAETAHHRIYTDDFYDTTVKIIASICHQCHHNYHFPPSIEEVKSQLFQKSLKPRKIGTEYRIRKYTSACPKFCFGRFERRIY